MKMANSFLGVGGRKGVSEEVETLGEAPPLLNYRLPRTVKNYDIYTVFLFRDPPPPHPEFLDPPLQPHAPLM